MIFTFIWLIIRIHFVFGSTNGNPLVCNAVVSIFKLGNNNSNRIFIQYYFLKFEEIIDWRI